MHVQIKPPIRIQITTNYPIRMHIYLLTNQNTVASQPIATWLQIKSTSQIAGVNQDMTTKQPANQNTATSKDTNQRIGHRYKKSKDKLRLDTFS